MHRSLLCPLLLICTFAFASRASAQADEGFRRLGALVPKEALAVLGATNLRQASDHLGQSIEAMDRGHLLLGGKPLDQLKAVLGFPVGVNDLGGVAIVLVPSGEGDAEDENGNLPGAMIAIVAITNAEDFLRGNFTKASPHESRQSVRTLEHARLGTLYGRAMGDHVALSSSADVLARMNPAEIGDDGETALLSGRNAAMARRGHGFLWVHNLKEAVQAMPRELSLLRHSFEMMEGVDELLVSLTFDALGFFIRSNVSAEHGSSFDAVLKAWEAGGDANPPMKLPDRPFLLAAAIRGGALAAAVRGATPSDNVQAIEFGWYSPPGEPDRAQRTVGFAVVRGGDPKSRRSVVEHLIKPTGDRWSIEWKRNVAVGEGGTRADAYEIRYDKQHPLDGVFQFNLEPRHGFVSDTGASMLITSGRDADPMERARELLAAGATPLAQNHVIAALRQWMPAGRIVEVYMDLGEIAAHERENFPDLPNFQRGAPPIAFGASRHEDGLESILILPREPLAPILDTAMSAFMKKLRYELERTNEP